MYPVLHARHRPRPSGHGFAATCVVAAAVYSLAGPAPASAQENPALPEQGPTGEPAQVSPELHAAFAALYASERPRVREGMELLGLTASDEAARLLTQRIRRGLPVDLLELAIETLQAMDRPEVSEVLVELARHRRPAVRLKALQALLVVRPPGASAAMIQGLDDLHPSVRAAAARGLRTAPDPEAKTALFSALEHGLVEAAVALGHVVDAADLDRLLEFVGRVPMQRLSPALHVLLERPELDGDAKLRVIGRIAQLATPEAKRLLEAVAAAIPNPADRVRQAAEAAAAPISE